MDITWKKKLNTESRGVFTTTVPLEVVRKYLKELVDVYSKSVEIPGFRKGNVPHNILIAQVGSEKIKTELRGRLQLDASNQFVRESGQKAVGPPMIKSGDDSLLDLDADYSFDVEFANEIGIVNPQHRNQMPIVGNISGGPLEIQEKLTSGSVTQGKLNEHLPEELVSANPSKVLADARTRVESLRDPEMMKVGEKPVPGKTDTFESVTKTTEPEDLDITPKYEDLDKKAEPPGTPQDI